MFYYFSNKQALQNKFAANNQHRQADKKPVDAAKYFFSANGYNNQAEKFTEYRHGHHPSKSGNQMSLKKFFKIHFLPAGQKRRNPIYVIQKFRKKGEAYIVILNILQ